MESSEITYWLTEVMKPNKPMDVTPEQVDKIKQVWDQLDHNKYQYSFNDNFTKIRKL